MIELLNEKIIKGENTYTLIQQLSSDSLYQNVNDFLNEIIKSKFHFWQGIKYPDGMTWNWSDNNITSVNSGIKTFGFYNNNQIVPDHYKRIDFHKFEKSLATYMFQETGDSDYVSNVKDSIQDYNRSDLSIFQFTIDINLERSKFSVYSSFIAFLLIETGFKKAIRIEFGED
jgi:hypothetical protein